jgi:predicted metalloprotease with PDZ domain
LSEQLQKHFDNPGRFSYSVAESSFDTWLDGYVPGVPGRKVSIYTEGCLLAFCADIMIRKASNNKANLDEVMKRLYYDFALKNIGITEKDYRNELENISGTSFEDFFKHYINGTHSLEGILVDSLDYLGLEIKQTPSKLYAEGRLGIKTIRKNGKEMISAIFPGSPGDLGGLAIHDEIISVNKTPINNDLDLWLKYFEDDIKSFEIFREGKSIENSLPEVNRFFYQSHEIEVKKSLIPSQQKAIAAWALDGVKE